MIAEYLRRNPRILLVLIIVIGVAGGSSLWVLPRMEDPILGKRVAVISTAFPGADAQRVDSLISLKIAAGLADLAEIETIRSTSRPGISNVAIELRDQVTDFDTAWVRVRDRMEQVESELPAQALAPRFERLELKAFAAILALRWVRDDPPQLVILSKLARELAAIVERLPGTEKTRLFGTVEEEIHVQLPASVVASTGLTPASAALQTAGMLSQQPAGVLRGGAPLLVDLESRAESMRFLEELPIRCPGLGGNAALGELASIRKGPREPPIQRALIDGREAATVCAFVRDDARVDSWNESLLAELAAFRQRLPEGIELDPVFLQADYVKARLAGLVRNLAFSSGAVVLVVLALMGWRSSVVVWAALPLSALMVLTGMRVLEIPIHQISVTGLIIALGLLIDNAIIIVEQVRSRRLEGAAPGEAVVDSIRHLAMPLFGSTLTTTLAFVPIALLPGAPGEFVGTLAVGVILAVNSSFLLSMTMIPAMAALLPFDRRRTGMLANGISIGWLRRLYEYSLRVVFRAPLLGLAVGTLPPLLGFFAARTLSEQFFPPSDREQIQIEIELSAAAESTDAYKTAVAIVERLERDAETERVHWFLGESAPTFFYNVVPRRKSAPYYGQAIVDLKHGVASGPLVRRLQSELDRAFSHCRVLVRQLEQGPPFDAPIEVRLQGPDLGDLQSLGSQIRLILSQTEHVVHTRSDLEETVPKLAVRLDENGAFQANLDRGDIARQLYAALEGVSAGTLTLGPDEYPVRVSLTEQDLHSVAQLAVLALPARPLPGPFSERVGIAAAPRGEGSTLLSAIAELELDSEVGAVTRIDGRLANEVKAYVEAGELPLPVLGEFKRRLEQSSFELPAGYALQYGGETSERDEAVRNLAANATVLVALIVLTLVLSFQSIRCAAIVTAVGGLSIGLGMGGIWLFGIPIGFMAIVGAMGLVGLAINDAIVVLAAIRADALARAGDRRQLVAVVVHNTRHVLTTTFTTMAGFAPLIWFGGEFWPPLAVAIAGGVGGATILALYFVPSLYLLIRSC